jgi:hypothetical protein
MTTDNLDFAFTIVGALGAFLILFGFYRTSIGRWTNKSLWYELDNVVGPSLMIVYALHFQAYVSAVINVIWIVVAFRGLIPFAERYGMRLRKQAKKRRRS